MNDILTQAQMEHLKAENEHLRAALAEPIVTSDYPNSHQRKPLTEEKMRECAQSMDAEPLAEGWTELIKFARAIEKAHGIGGEA